MSMSEVHDNEIKNEEVFSISDPVSYFRIAFDQIFEQEKLNVYNDFDLTAKRHFKNLSADILETYVQLFTEDGRLNDEATLTVLKLLSSQTKIMTSSAMPLSEFLNILEDIISSGDEILLQIIHNFVETNYSLELDKITENMIKNKKTVNEELFISDDAAKKYLEISYLSRLLIPVISQYLIYNKSSFPVKTSNVEVISDEPEEELIFDDVTFTIFKYIFDRIAKDDAEKLRNKLYKMVFARVIRTALPAERFWRMASNLGMSIQTEVIEIYKKLLTNSMTKLKCTENLNIVSFFSAVINKQTDFLFQNKFKYHYQAIDYSTGERMNSNDDDDMSEFEKIEIKNARKDEGALVLQNIVIKDTIDRLPELLNVSVTEEEIRDTVSIISKNTIQEKIISLITTKYFEDTTAIKRLSAAQYAKVLLCCKKFLEAHKFVLLTQILTSKCEKNRERVGITGVKIKQKIEESKKYKVLFAKKYSAFKDLIDKQLSSLIASIYSSEFKDSDNNDLFDPSIKLGNIAEELVELVYLT